MTEALSLSHVKAHFSDVVDRVEHEHQRVLVTRKGRPAAVLLSPDDLQALEDTLDLLSDHAAMADIERARDEVRQGRTVDADELRAKYLSR